MKPTAFIVVLVLLAGCDQPPQQQATAPTISIALIQAVEPVIVQAEPVYRKNIAETFTAKIVRIVDGDTIEGLTGDNTKFKIRLEGIDTPEPKQAFGNVAKKAVGDLTHEKNVGNLRASADGTRT